MNFSEPSIEGALGVVWNVVSDKFTFKVTLKEKEPSRRVLLSIVSSVYDPLGFILVTSKNLITGAMQT